ncbi:hypothetical protein BDK51DRAFT_45548 [Blyttiomyces helicus]|uniref:Uncharacterized protein n=1 Tax=Blyttiomyces helicus TaxID=388810 RepID=A0A4P9WL27_9FUNG|nr:hypothetical protein BDK51DRAFT_45548 [Blyttiomyces helicus]|eukprot:RKO91890.1 hypothetical protein BDK51DRAFT_45548 [Blyttiomyces helicus]
MSSWCDIIGTLLSESDVSDWSDGPYARVSVSSRRTKKETSHPQSSPQPNYMAACSCRRLLLFRAARPPLPSRTEGGGSVPLHRPGVHSIATPRWPAHRPRHRPPPPVRLPPNRPLTTLPQRPTPLSPSELAPLLKEIDSLFAQGRASEWETPLWQWEQTTHQTLPFPNQIYSEILNCLVRHPRSVELAAVAWTVLDRLERKGVGTREQRVSAEKYGQVLFTAWDPQGDEPFSGAAMNVLRRFSDYGDDPISKISLVTKRTEFCKILLSALEIVGRGVARQGVAIIRSGEQDFPRVKPVLSLSAGLDQLVRRGHVADWERLLDEWEARGKMPTRQIFHRILDHLLQPRSANVATVARRVFDRMKLPGRRFDDRKPNVETYSRMLASVWDLNDQRPLDDEAMRYLCAFAAHCDWKKLESRSARFVANRTPAAAMALLGNGSLQQGIKLMQERVKKPVLGSKPAETPALPTASKLAETPGPAPVSDLAETPAPAPASTSASDPAAAAPAFKPWVVLPSSPPSRISKPAIKPSLPSTAVSRESDPAPAHVSKAIPAPEPSSATSPLKDPEPAPTAIKNPLSAPPLPFC